MIGLEVRFLAGRYHANGWHHAHNEGVPEWPPSPWRVLRALVAAAFALEVPTDRVSALVEKLRSLPRYRLPHATDAHTRHYMPESEANDRRAKVFDSFVVIEGGARDPQPVTIAWDIELTTDERELLATLARRVTYLGRAESWADVAVTSVADGAWQCWPEETASTSHKTTLLAPAPADDLARWSAGMPMPKKGPDVPRSLIDVLTFDGARYREEGWTDLPGTRRVRYAFAGAPFRRAVVPRRAARVSDRPNVARFAIRSAVLPRIEEALALGERLRVAMMSRTNARPIFSGHGDAASNHRHAMYLAECSDPQSRSVDHLVICAREGFAAEDVLAIQNLRKVWGHGGHALQLILVGLGDGGDFGGLLSPRSRMLARARVWESVTPFVPTRHPKVVRGLPVDDIEGQIRRSCEQLLGIAPRIIEPNGDRATWARFRRRRLRGGGRRGPDWAVGARLVFDEPVAGPIALGYASHFGLGLFQAIE